MTRGPAIGAQFDRAFLLEMLCIRQDDADQGIPRIIRNMAYVSGVPRSLQRTGPGTPGRVQKAGKAQWEKRLSISFDRNSDDYSIDGKSFTQHLGNS
ncbi:hypothetical protein C1M51_03125 [Methylibium sp. Pch-M]|nr:hypothetical protein C1M51_03125 [Methylibium sp. Pch-M]